MRNRTIHLQAGWEFSSDRAACLNVENVLYKQYAAANTGLFSVRDDVR